MSNKVNKDRLTSINRTMTARGTFTLLDVTSQFPPEYQVACPAVLVLALCDAYKLDPVDVMAVARNWLHDRRNDNDERVKAMEFYIKRNLLGKQ